MADRVDSGRSGPARSRDDAARVAQEAVDAYERSRIGGLFFVATWILMCVTARQYGLREWLIGAAFLSLSGSRLFVGAFIRRAAQPRFAHLAATYAIMIATMLAWGFAAAFALVHPDFAATPTVMLFATSAFVTAYVHNYPMRIWPALAGLLAGYGPAWFALMLSDRDGAVPIATGVAIHTVYLVLAARRAHFEYHRSIDLEHELRAQRDLFSQRSRVDSLTGIANRGEFGERLAAAIEDARAGGRAPSVLIIDLDFFKAINDERGHAAGDACLIEVAARLTAQFDGAGQLPARLGGEEFGVVLTDCDAAVAQARAELFRLELASKPIVFGDIDIPVTASIGVGTFDEDAHADADALYREVDLALYRAKREGRNRVATAAASDPRNRRYATRSHEPK